MKEDNVKGAKFVKLAEGRTQALPLVPFANSATWLIGTRITSMRATSAKS